MDKGDLEELRKLSLDELLKKYSLEELEKLLPLEEILKKFPDIKKDEGRETGVLLSGEIRRYVKEFRLIEPFDGKNLKAASYYLTVGDEYALGGKKSRLYDNPDKNVITIPHFQVAIIKTKEIINMPRFLIGRWNIRVTKAYEGLLWVGGPQVDPGWVGHLFCPVYNLSDEDVILEKGKPLATIDFVRTTTFKEEKEEEIYLFHRPPRRQTIDDYNPRLESALFTQAAQRIDEVEKKVSRVESMTTIIFTVLAILVAALSIFVFLGQTSVPVSRWVYLGVGISIAALIIAIVALIKAREKRRS